MRTHGERRGRLGVRRGCIRTHLILREKARRFHDDPEIRAALDTSKAFELAEPTLPPDDIDAQRQDAPDSVALGQRGHGLEHLDQLVNELLLGVRQLGYELKCVLARRFRGASRKRRA